MEINTYFDTYDGSRHTNSHFSVDSLTSLCGEDISDKTKSIFGHGYFLYETGTCQKCKQILKLMEAL